MDDPEDSKYTLSFDLLFKGLEITTGGQRIHDYQKLMEKIEARGMETDGMDQYLAHFQTWNAATRWTWNRTGTTDDAAHREKTMSARQRYFPRDLSRLEP